MLRNSYQKRVNWMYQRPFMKAITDSRKKKGYLNVLFPILVGMAIGTLATFILKLMSGKFSF